MCVGGSPVATGVGGHSDGFALASTPSSYARELANQTGIHNRTYPRTFALSSTRPLASTNFRVDGEPAIPDGLMLRVAELLRVLGQPVRLRLIEQLKRGPSTPQELSDAIGTSQQNVSKHLLALHRAGVVSRQPQGSNVIYTLTDESALAILNETLASVKRHLRELSELAAPPPEDG